LPIDVFESSTRENTPALRSFETEDERWSLIWKTFPNEN
jgi:hypothetical protein